MAPLSNQLRLVERELTRLTAHEKADDRLPNPELFGLVTSIASARWMRGRSVPARRRPASDYVVRESEIFQIWKDVGFELSPKPAPIDDDVADRAALEVWVEDQRAELMRCLPAEKEDEGRGAADGRPYDRGGG